MDAAKRDWDNPAYKSWRIAVKKRDRFECQLCSSKKTVQAHHIKKWSSHPAERFSITNGITLCKRCHKQVTGNEEHYEKFFIDIIASKLLDKLNPKKAKDNE